MILLLKKEKQTLTITNNISIILKHQIKFKLLTSVSTKSFAGLVSYLFQIHTFYRKRSGKE